MPSERKIVTYRPDARERVLLEKLADKRGISASRLIGQLVREAAERESVRATDEEIAAKESKE